MTIGVLTLDLHLPQARSLKDKRQVVRSVKERMRARHNVAVAEAEETADLWQRTSLTVASLAVRRETLDALFDTLVRDAESQVPGNVMESGRDFLDTIDGAGPEEVL